MVYHLAAISLLAVYGLTANAAENNFNDSSIEDLASLSLDDLSQLDVVVSSVSRKAQKLSSTASAVYVIDQDAIRRSGVTSIPEALRMAPGVQVAKIDGSRWAITARGDNGRFAANLLVMVDGRSVYNPLFSGVYWDVQDYLLEDVERIEVVRGPGATVWGSNAVNGVINIITRDASSTQGWLLSGGSGSEEEGFYALRYGGNNGDALNYRFYVKGLQRDSAVDFNGADGVDDSEASQGGFRVDWQASTSNHFTLQGDVRDGEASHEDGYFSLTAPYAFLQRVEEQADNENILGRWRHTPSSDSEFELQVYYDHAERSFKPAIGLISQSYTVFDIDFQHRWLGMTGHDLVWGGGYRRIDTDFDNGPTVQFTPQQRTLEFYNLFFQDEISLLDDQLMLTWGSKFEHNPYTGLEIQPSVRAHWQFSEDYSMWAAISRAVRIPSLASENIHAQQTVTPPGPGVGPLPVQTNIVGSLDSESAKLTAYEFGFRGRVNAEFSYDLAAFYNDYDDLLTFHTGAPVVQAAPIAHVDMPLILGNHQYAESYGFEASLQWQPTNRMNFDLTYGFVDLQFHTRDVPGVVVDESEEGLTPEHQLSLRSSFDLNDQLDLDVWLRYVDDLPADDVDNYTTMDVRLAWRPIKGLELSLVGQNLLQSEHEEFKGEVLVVSSTQVERGVYAKLSWSFGD